MIGIYIKDDQLQDFFIRIRQRQRFKNNIGIGDICYRQLIHKAFGGGSKHCNYTAPFSFFEL